MTSILIIILLYPGCFSNEYYVWDSAFIGTAVISINGSPLRRTLLVRTPLSSLKNVVSPFPYFLIFVFTFDLREYFFDMFILLKYIYYR